MHKLNCGFVGFDITISPAFYTPEPFKDRNPCVTASSFGHIASNHSPFVAMLPCIDVHDRGCLARVYRV
jgi:hypothetical protein